VTLDSVAVHRFEVFSTLLNDWNKTSNLISCSSARELIERHFVDSLAIAPLIEFDSTLVDLGSGAGFPGSRTP